LISDEYFSQVPVKSEVGSSTMPHKINPINFENAKGNIPLASHMLSGIIDVLMNLTYQRDMSDSTVLRSVGSAFGYFMLAFGEICVGIDKLIPNELKIKEDLDKYAIVIMEGIQTYLKKIGCKTAYELAKEFSRRSDMSITLSDIHHYFIAKLDVSDDIKTHLLKLTPETYVGSYPELTLFKYDII
jgi:adenylosuccinate lyase